MWATSLWATSMIDCELRVSTSKITSILNYTISSTLFFIYNKPLARMRGSFIICVPYSAVLWKIFDNLRSRENNRVTPPNFMLFQHFVTCWICTELLNVLWFSKTRHILAASRIPMAEYWIFFLPNASVDIAAGNFIFWISWTLRETNAV
jgi:hypothetical protein